MVTRTFRSGDRPAAGNRPRRSRMELSISASYLDDSRLWVAHQSLGFGARPHVKQRGVNCLHTELSDSRSIITLFEFSVDRSIRWRRAPERSPRSPGTSNRRGVGTFPLRDRVPSPFRDQECLAYLSQLTAVSPATLSQSSVPAPPSKRSMPPAPSSVSLPS